MLYYVNEGGLNCLNLRDLPSHSSHLLMACSLIPEKGLPFITNYKGLKGASVSAADWGVRGPGRNGQGAHLPEG